MPRKVSVDGLNVSMELGNNGIKLQVTDAQGKHRGYLQVTRAHVKWFKGKGKTPKKISWDKFIEQMES